MIHTEVQYKLHGSCKIFLVGRGGGLIMDMMLETIFDTNIFSTIFLIETQNNSPDFNLKTHSQWASSKGWTKGTKYSVSILWFISTQLTLTLLLNTKFKTALAETKRQGWVGEAGFKHSSARSTPLGWALFPISAFRAAPEVSCFLLFHLFPFLVCCESYYKFSTYHPKVYTRRI